MNRSADQSERWIFQWGIGQLIRSIQMDLPRGGQVSGSADLQMDLARGGQVCGSADLQMDLTGGGQVSGFPPAKKYNKICLKGTVAWENLKNEMVGTNKVLPRQWISYRKFRKLVLHYYCFALLYIIKLSDTSLFSLGYWFVREVRLGNRCCV